VKKIIACNLVVLLSLLSIGFVHVQNEEITLSFSRDFGYSSGLGKIQGLFSIKATANIPLSEVDFYIDSQVIGKDSSEPFKIQFSTDDYPLGVHKIYAIGLSSDDKQIKSKEVIVEFVSAKEGNRAALSIIISVLGLVIIVAILSAVIPALISRKKGNVPAGSVRNYGLAGGTICSRCKRPFAMHFLAPNMLMGKLERCPYCGKWGIVRSFPMEKLREAEEAEATSKWNLSSNSEEQKEDLLKKEIDESKYQSM
jgi:DNA-directed RNA polymerase subunit RPC12/RpoP